MRVFATKISALLPVVLLFATLSPVVQTTQAQVPLGDEFIVFVEGLNVLVPENDFTAIPDPTNPDNTVARFGSSDWAAPGFRWDGATGADFTEMVTPDGVGGKTLYLKLWVSPSLAGKDCLVAGGNGFDPCLSITLFDASTGGNFEDDREGRLKWGIPQDMIDGNWHDLAIPLPPDNFDSWKAAKDAGTLDPLAMNWQYAGGWANGWGWGGTAGSAHGTADAVNWQPFQWDKVRGITVHFDWNPDGVTGGDVLIDDIYIGDATTNLDVAINPPAKMSGVSVVANGTENMVSWTHNPDFGGYNVYVDEEPITQARIEAGEVAQLSSLAFNASAFEVNHRYEIPHPSLSDLELHYAVTSTNLFGVPNTDVLSSAQSVSNGDLAQQPFIVEVTDAQSDVIVGNVIGNNVSPAGFPDGMAPFVMDMNHVSAGDGGQLADSDEDLSAKLWMAFNRTWNELYLYAEVTDDVVARHPGTGTDCLGCDTWMHDSFEIAWGAYDVRDVVGGSLLGGSPHENFGRGAEPDHQIRFAWTSSDASPDPLSSSSFNSPFPGQDNEANGELLGVKTVFGDLMDGANVIGYRFISAFNLAAAAVGTDQVTPLPAEDEILLIPFNFGINDDDNPDTGLNREAQIQWSIKPSASSQWWNTPSEWMTVAIAGINAPGAPTGVANEDLADVPKEFSLRQNYPNPFNPTTNIEFTLPNVQDVTLSVYNVLGQRVATLIDNQQMSAGQHAMKFDARSLSSGVYLYRLEAGKTFTQSRSMLLLK